MRASGGYLQPLLPHQVYHHAAFARQLAAQFSRRLANGGTDLDDGLVQLRFELLAQDGAIVLQKLGNVRMQLARLRVDNLVLLFNSQGKRWRFHGVLSSSPYGRCSSMTKELLKS